MDWDDVTCKYHKLTFDHDGQMSALPHEWQRELAALWRLEGDVNNGAYLQFLSNWGRESYAYASRALKKIGAHKMAEIIDRCQALVDKHFDSNGKSPGEMSQLVPSEIIDPGGNAGKEPGSVLPDAVIDEINDLSYEFMKYPDDMQELGVQYYRSRVKNDGPE